MGDRLQLAGEGILAVFTQGAEGFSELARRCVEGLRDRTWTGDADLADQLEAALGDRAAPSLRPLTVDLEELASFLKGDPANGGGRINLRTGDVWTQAAVDLARKEERDDPDNDDPDRWLAVRCESSSDAYRDMEDFIATLDEEDRADPRALPAPVVAVLGDRLGVARI